MKIPDANQLRGWDEATIEKQNITSLVLMERAAQQCTDWIADHYKFGQKQILIICGKGNNGGDGLAIARQLQQRGFNTNVFIADWDEKESNDFKKNKERLQQTDVKISFIKSENEFPNIDANSLVIEALFGFGLNRKLEGNHAALINYINQQNAIVISIDVPAGMFTDATSKGNVMVKAATTLTFQTLKLCFLMAENADYFGDVHVLSIGLNQEFETTLQSKFVFTDISMVSSFYKKRKQFSNKGTYGHALLVAGNEGKVGAAVMCATSCLRSGVGLLSCSLPPNDFAILHTAIPEAMMIERGKEDDVSKYSVIGAGPGLGKEEATTLLLHKLLQQFKKPMLIDADALNLLAEHEDWWKDVPQGSVLTPHPKEFDRLFGESGDDFERMNKAVENSGKNKVIIVLKGAYTLVTDGERSYFNSTGNNGLATGGSGDILTGLITGLLSQHYEPFAAAIVGVYLHGLAADLCLDEQSFESLLPMDVVQHFGKAFKQLQNEKGA